MVEVLFIHSAGTQGPGEGSNPLVAALREALPSGFSLRAPIMPEPDAPEAEPWIAAVKAETGGIAADFILVGHSLGGSILLQALERHGVPENLLGVVVLAAPFWGAPDWAYESFALSADAPARLKGLRKVIIMRGDRDEVVAEDHPERYRKVLPQGEIRILPGIDHEAANAAPELARAIADIARS